MGIVNPCECRCENLVRGRVHGGFDLRLLVGCESTLRGHIKEETVCVCGVGMRSTETATAQRLWKGCGRGPSLRREWRELLGDYCSLKWGLLSKR